MTDTRVSALLPTETTVFYEAEDGDAGTSSYYAAPVDAVHVMGTNLGVRAGAGPIMTHFFAEGDDLYFVHHAPAPGAPTNLAKCPKAGCSGTPSFVVSPFQDSEFAVDGSSPAPGQAAV